MISNNEYEINICVPADDVERPDEPIPTPDDIIFDFNKINITLARKYVHIIVGKDGCLDEYKFDIMNEEDAHRIIKEFIINYEKYPELVFQVGVCEKTILH